MVGQGVLYLTGDWKDIFLVLAASGLTMFLWVMTRLPETLHPEDITPIEPRAIGKAWHQVLFHRNSIGHVLASGLMMAPLFAYITTAQQIFFDIFDAADIFVYIFALNAAAMSVGNFVNARIVMRFGARRVSQAALIFFIIVALAQSALAVSGMMGIVAFTLLLMPAMAMVGFTGANFSSIAMQPFGKVAGVASSFQNFARTTISASLGATIGLQFDGTLVPLAMGFLICGAASLAVVTWAEHGQLFRRVQTGVTTGGLVAND